MVNFEGSNGILSNGNSNNGEQQTDENGNIVDVTGNPDLEPIENKHNDLTKFWSVETGEMYMNSDTPAVEIYISREKPVEEEGEGGESHETTIEEYVEKNPETKEIIGNNPDITSKNTTVVKFNMEEYLAKNAVDKINADEVNANNTTSTNGTVSDINVDTNSATNSTNTTSNS